MSRAERLQKSKRARSRRSGINAIKETIQKRRFSDMKRLRKKYQKIKSRHHDNKL